MHYREGKSILYRFVMIAVVKIPAFANISMLNLFLNSKEALNNDTCLDKKHTLGGKSPELTSLFDMSFLIRPARE